MTERGSFFGYRDLVVDYRSTRIMREAGFPVVFDATHSVQSPGSTGTTTGGTPELIPLLARCGVAAGADAVFLEVHPEPARAKSDAGSQLPLEAFAGAGPPAGALPRTAQRGDRVTAPWPPRSDAAYRAEAEARLGADLADRFAAVDLLVLDVDGVLTDGVMYYGAEGEQLKGFHSHDGLGLALARLAGLKRAVLTGRDSAIVARRCAELRFDTVKLGRFDKGTALDEILAETGGDPARDPLHGGRPDRPARPAGGGGAGVRAGGPGGGAGAVRPGHRGRRAAAAPCARSSTWC